MAHHIHGMQKIFDINSQNSLLSALPSSRSEPDLHLQQGFVSMPENPTIHQYGYGSMLLEQASSSVSPSYSSHVQEPSLVAMTENSFHFITPMPPTSEPDLHLQQGFVSMPENPTIHQYGYGPMLLEQASSSVSPSYSSHVQEPSLVAMTDNSFGFLTPMPPMSEPDLHLQQGFVSMPENPIIHQYGYGPMLLEQASSSLSPSYSSHVQEPSLVAMTDNSFGFITPMPPMLHDDDVEDSINELINAENACDIQGQSDILHQTATLSSNIQSSQDLEIERLLGHVRAYEMQKQLAARASMNGVTQCDKGKLPESSSTRHIGAYEKQKVDLISTNGAPIEYHKKNIPESSSTREQLSPNILKILKTNDKYAFFIPSNIKRGRTRKPLSEELIKKLENFKPAPLGRPPKRREGGEPSFNYGKFQKRNSGTRTIGMTAKPKEADKTTENVQNEDQSANLTNPSSAPRQYLNSAYDPKYQKDGDFVDPLLRLFNAITGK